MRTWLDETYAPFPVLLDPDRIAYQMYGLERSLLRSWGVKTIAEYARLLWSGRKWRGILGDSGQLGGDFIVDSKGIVRFIYRSYDPTDRPSAELLISYLEKLKGDGSN
jgi:hypothetical protein